MLDTKMAPSQASPYLAFCYNDLYFDNSD